MVLVSLGAGSFHPSGGHGCDDWVRAATRCPSASFTLKRGAACTSPPHSQELPAWPTASVPEWGHCVSALRSPRERPPACRNPELGQPARGGVLDGDGVSSPGRGRSLVSSSVLLQFQENVKKKNQMSLLYWDFITHFPNKLIKRGFINTRTGEL